MGPVLSAKGLTAEAILLEACQGWSQTACKEKTCLSHQQVGYGISSVVKAAICSQKKKFEGNAPNDLEWWACLG